MQVYLYFTGIDTDTLYENFVQPKIKVGAEWVTKGQNTAQANSSVAGIARAIFERQFRYLVIKCNESLVDPTMRRYPILPYKLMISDQQNETEISDLFI